MAKSRSWKKADYPNAKPSWRRHPIKFKEKKTQVQRVLNSLDWDKLAIIGKEKRRIK